MTLKNGQAVEFKNLPPICQEDLRAYSFASGDPNPIHLDEEVAKKAGLPGVIAHGMLTAGFLASRADGFLRESGLSDFTLTRFQTRFKAMTLLGDVISVGGVVKEASHRALILELQARNQRGDVTSTAVAHFKYDQKTSGPEDP